MMRIPPPSPDEPAVVLLSGGLDSTTVLALAASRGYRCHCLSFAYGQRHHHELELAERNAGRWGIRHLVLRLDLDRIGGSALTSDLAVPKGRELAVMESEIPVTYVPGRNTIFLSYAAAWAEVLGARRIFIGVNAVDYSGYPDCRPDYLAALEKALNLGSKVGRQGAGLSIIAPLLHLQKKEIIARGLELGVDYGLTHSCYDPAPDGRACGCCDACLLRAKGFREAGRRDPALSTEQPAP